MVQAVNPYLNFPGNTLQAFEFYRAVFGGEFPMVLRYRDFPDNMGVPEDAADHIAHIALPIGPAMLMGTDAVGGEPVRVGNNTHMVMEADDAAEARRLFDALSAGGRATMPLQRTEWAELYGTLTDRFGVQWMVSYQGEVQFRP
jgi:PhnB protein